MSSIVLQVGQCGNQIGQKFWKIGQDNKQNNDDCIYVHPERKVRAVCVDSEPKVIKNLVEADTNGQLRQGNLITGKRGRGTNWALGYYGNKYEDQDTLVEKTLEAVRREIERCSNFTGIIMMHSLSGGTGSGLGSRLCEEIKECYPMNYLLSCVVAPYISGESPLQHYNTLLSLSKLQNNTDGIMLFYNDEVQYRLQKRLQGRGQENTGISLNKMNHHIASCIGGICFPVDSITPSYGTSIGMEPWEMIRSVCPIPSTIFLHANHVARSKLSWDGLAQKLVSTLQRHDQNTETFSSIANLLVARGDANNSFFAYQSDIDIKLRHIYGAVSWNPHPIDYWTAKSNFQTSKDASTLTMASNYSNIIEYAEHIIQKAKAKYDVKAYLHWYWKYGAEEDDFQSSFDTMETVARDYTEAVK